MALRGASLSLSVPAAFCCCSISLLCWQVLFLFSFHAFFPPCIDYEASTTRLWTVFLFALQHRSLPGVMSGELASKNGYLFNVNFVGFSSDSRAFAVATSHGLYIYGIDLFVGGIFVIPVCCVLVMCLHFFNSGFPFDSFFSYHFLCCLLPRAFCFALFPDSYLFPRPAHL